MDSKTEQQKANENLAIIDLSELKNAREHLRINCYLLTSDIGKIDSVIRDAKPICIQPKTSADLMKELEEEAFNYAKSLTDGKTNIDVHTNVRVFIKGATSPIAQKIAREGYVSLEEMMDRVIVEIQNYENEKENNPAFDRIKYLQNLKP